MLPVLHLNGYKIANPTVLARIPNEELQALFEGYGYSPRFVEGSDPAEMHELMAATLDRAVDDIRAAQERARGGDRARPAWPMIVLRTPKGWTGPKEVDGKPAEGSFRSHQVPLSGLAQRPEHLEQLETWLRSYRPEELFDERGALVAELQALAPEGDRRMGASPHANGGLLLRAAPAARLPRLRRRGRPAGDLEQRGDPRPRALPARRDAHERRQLPRGRPRRDRVEPARRRCSRSRTAPGWPQSSRATITSRRTAA